VGKKRGKMGETFSNAWKKMVEGSLGGKRRVSRRAEKNHHRRKKKNSPGVEKKELPLCKRRKEKPCPKLQKGGGFA